MYLSRAAEKDKELRVTEASVNSSLNSSPSLSPQDDKSLPSTSSSINLESQVPSASPYHVFSRSQKVQMVCIVSLAAIFSPLSSNIYFPALGEISRVGQHNSNKYPVEISKLTHI